MPITEKQKEIAKRFLKVFIKWYRRFSYLDWDGKRRWRERCLSFTDFLQEVDMIFNRIDDEDIKKAWQEAKGRWYEDWEYIVEHEDKL